jgi:hypothetical protein
MARVQISSNHEECTASAHLEYPRGRHHRRRPEPRRCRTTTAPMIGPLPTVVLVTASLRPRRLNRRLISFCAEGRMAAPITRRNNGPIGEPTRAAFAATWAGTPWWPPCTGSQQLIYLVAGTGSCIYRDYSRLNHRYSQIWLSVLVRTSR